MSAGRCKVTVTREDIPEHLTVQYVCFADNREKQFDPNSGKRWVNCQLEDATHVFAEVPTPSGQYNDKIGTYYPTSGRWFEADNADPQRIRAAILTALWLQDQKSPFLLGFNFEESVECGKCGAELSDPVSIARGIGPDCYGQLTGSSHQVKWQAVAHPGQQILPENKTVRELDGSVKIDHAHKYHETSDPEDTYEDLGLPSAAENAVYHLLKGMSEDQLLTCKEWVEMRIAEVKQIRHDLVQEARDAAVMGVEQAPAPDTSFMGR